MNPILVLFGVFIVAQCASIPTTKPPTTMTHKPKREERSVAPVVLSTGSGLAVIHAAGATVIRKDGDSIVISSPRIVSRAGRSPRGNNGVNAPFINGGGSHGGNNGINAPFINGGSGGGSNGINAPFINGGGGGGSNGINAPFVNGGGGRGSNGINAPFQNGGR